jgi:hypothetical protein
VENISEMVAVVVVDITDLVVVVLEAGTEVVPLVV